MIDYEGLGLCLCWLIAFCAFGRWISALDVWLARSCWTFAYESWLPSFVRTWHLVLVTNSSSFTENILGMQSASSTSSVKAFIEAAMKTYTASCQLRMQSPIILSSRAGRNLPIMHLWCHLLSPTDMHESAYDQIRSLSIGVPILKLRDSSMTNGEDDATIEFAEIFQSIDPFVVSYIPIPPLWLKLHFWSPRVKMDEYLQLWVETRDGWISTINRSAETNHIPGSWIRSRFVCCQHPTSSYEEFRLETEFARIWLSW